MTLPKAAHANGRGASRFELTVLPKPYQEFLINRIPGLADLRPEHQRRILHILTSEPLREKYSHRRGRGIFYPAETLRKHYGKHYKAIMPRFFDIDPHYWHEPGSPSASFTKTYTVRKEIISVVYSYLETRESGPCEILINGIPYRSRCNAIYKYDINGNMKKSPAKIAPPLPVNVQNLQGMERYLNSLWDRLFYGKKPPESKFAHLYKAIKERSTDIDDEVNRTETWLRITGEMLRLSNIKPLPFGFMLQLYQETSTGRLQGQGMHLQTVPSPLRMEALRGQGMFLYDFDNCHYSILQQLYPEELPTVTKYNSDKSAFRGTISTDIGVSIGQVKKALISIIYGAKDAEGWTVSDYMGDKASAFLEHPLIRGLFSDIKTARGHIISSTRRETNNKGRVILNAMGKSIKEKEDPKTILAHILQGVEAAMLNAILEKHGENIKLLLFDGFISNRELDAQRLQGLVHEKTGFAVKIDAEKLP